MAVAASQAENAGSIPVTRSNTDQLATIDECGDLSGSFGDDGAELFRLDFEEASYCEDRFDPDAVGVDLAAPELPECSAVEVHAGHPKDLGRKALIADGPVLLLPRLARLCGPLCEISSCVLVRCWTSHIDEGTPSNLNAHPGEGLIPTDTNA